MTDHYEQASAEARDRGMAFLVDGCHVNADRIMILSVPDTVGPISAMRTAKIDAQAALKDMEAFAANVSKPMNKAHVAMTGQHIRQLLDACGLEKKSHWDDTYLGMHSYIMMSDIEDRVRGLMSEMNALIAANNDLREIVHGGRTVTGDTSMPFLNAVAPLPEGARWIDGILVTDPDLAAPITDDATGTSTACGVCGKLFDHPSSLFCAEHRQS